jgi:hypothetical protein
MTNPRQALVEVAATQIGVHETSRNAGPEILKYWQATNYEEGMRDRQPWCAAFLAWVVFEGMKRPGGKLLALGNETRPRSAAVAEWTRWAMKPEHGCLVFGPRDPKYKPEPGDVFTLAAVSHIGLVEKFDGRLVTSIEGNTNDEGSREGWKVCRRTRKLREIRNFLRFAARGVRA